MLQGTPFVPGRAEGLVVYGPAKATEDRIVVLRAGALTGLARRPAGLIVIDAAPLSHAMIRVLGWGVPTVALRAEAATALVEGERLALDGGTGWLGPPDDAPPVRPAPSVPRAGHAVSTADGQSVILRASIGHVDAAARAVDNGAEAIGLVRSELLSRADGTRPGLAFYQETIAAICRDADPLSVTVRLLDLAADKHPLWLRPTPAMIRPLGLQGARVYQHPQVHDVFCAQVDAVGGLATDWPLSLLVPYVTRPEEFEHWREVVEDRLPLPMAVGVMAETPAAALEMADWPWMADLVAIGCNDLMQALFAADRDIAELAHLLDPYAPVLFRFLHEVADAAGDAVGDIQVCGLLPQLPGILPVMLGLGFRTFSVEPVMVPYLARTAGETDTTTAEGLAARVRAARHAAEVRIGLGLPADSSWGGAAPRELT